MENSFHSFVFYIRNIQIEKIKNTDGQYQISMHTFRMKHAFCKHFSYSSRNLLCRKAPGLHGGADSYLAAKQHCPKQPVLAGDTACRKHADSQKNPCRKFSVLYPQPDKSGRHVSQNKKSEIRKIGKQRVKEQQNIPLCFRFSVDFTEKINRKGNGRKGNPKGRKHIEGAVRQPQKPHKRLIIIVFFLIHILCKQNAGKNRRHYFEQISCDISRISR